MELMLVVAIIGILAAIAVPLYGNYTSRARAAAAIVELASIKLAINECIPLTSTRVGYNAGTNTIPAIGGFDVTRNVIELTSITEGIITATTGATDTIGTALTYINTPTVAVANIIWTNTGTICNPTRDFRSGTRDCP